MKSQKFYYYNTLIYATVNFEKHFERDAVDKFLPDLKNRDRGMEQLTADAMSIKLQTFVVKGSYFIPF